MTPEQLEEFNSIAYAYRCAPGAKPAEVVERFNALVAYVDKLIAKEKV